MDVFASAAHVTLHNVKFGDFVAVQEVRIDAQEVSLVDGRTVRARESVVRLLVTEAALNAAMAAQEMPTVTHLEVSTLTGRLSVSGKWRRLGGIPVPFRALGVPRIEGGARLQFEWQQISVVGIPLPGVQIIGEALNAQLAREFDITRFPLPIRLTGVTVEPGRITVTAAAHLASPALPTAAPGDGVLE